MRIANDSPFGLGGSVFTADAKHGAEVAKRISTCMVFINHPSTSRANLPFGGIKRSGYGRELIGLGIKEFGNHKLISSNFICTSTQTSIPAAARLLDEKIVSDPSSPHSNRPPDSRCCAPDFFLEPACHDAPRQQSRKSMVTPIFAILITG